MPNNPAQKNEEKKRKKKPAEIEKKNETEGKEEKTSHLVEVVVDSIIICRRLSELQARPCNLSVPEKRQL